LVAGDCGAHVHGSDACHRTNGPQAPASHVASEISPDVPAGDAATQCEQRMFRA
jgi:hypothetical protein